MTNPGQPDWEMYLDLSYFDMWAVRPVGDKDFNSPRLFHFSRREEADSFLALVQKSTVAEKRNKE